MDKAPILPFDSHVTLTHRPEMCNTRPGMSYMYAYKIYTYPSKELFASNLSFVFNMFWAIKGYYFEFDDYFYGSDEGTKREEVYFTLVGRKHVQTIV